MAFRYEWDELGRLSRARRWDFLAIDVNNPPSALLPPAADLRYKYDSEDERVLKTAIDPLLRQRHTAYVFDSLELRRAQYTGLGNAADYQLSTLDPTGFHVAEVPYLLGNDVRLARVVYQPDPGALIIAPSSQHVLFELGDHLGSTDLVLDKATSELVEKSTYQPYGAAETDYRPDRWNDFREDYKFTGKEEDVEVGLQYFGKRYLNPLLNRWCEADPLALHDPTGGDLNLYAYVRGMALRATDPVGLEEKVPVQQCFVDPNADMLAQGKAEAEKLQTKQEMLVSLDALPKLDAPKSAISDRSSHGNFRRRGCRW
jgi:RHS repeat-associated protein